jgi:hypothetical protein
MHTSLLETLLNRKITHAQQLVIIQWMDSCIPKEEEEVFFVI